MCARTGLLFGLLMLAPAVAYAQAATQDAKQDAEAAGQAFRAGVAAANAGRWEEARDAFDLSYRLRPHPNTLLNLAGAQAQTGRLVAAVRSYRLFLAEGGSNDRAMREAAEKYAATLEKKLGHLRLDLRGLEPLDSVRLDGTPLESLPIHETMPVDPGAHVADVQRGGNTVATQRFELAEGEHKILAIDAQRAKPTVIREDDSTVFESFWFWTAVGLVVAGGVTVGILANGSDEPVDKGNVGSITVPLR